MRKNLQKVFDAFLLGKADKGVSTKNGTACSTDGTKIFSYRLMIAERLPNGLVRVIEPNSTATTNKQINDIRCALGPRKVMCDHTDCSSNDEMAQECARDRQRKWDERLRG